MKKITCNYCGCKIDIDNNTHCPNCGGDFSTNEEFIQYKNDEKMYEEEKKRAEIQQQYADAQKSYAEAEKIQQDISQKEKMMEHHKNTEKAMKQGKRIGCMIYIIIFIVFSAFAIYGIINANKDKFSDAFKIESTSEQEEQSEVIETPIEKQKVNFGDEADFGTYKIKCDEVSPYVYQYAYTGIGAPKENHKFIRLKISITNTTDEIMYYEIEDYSASCDGEECQSDSIMLNSDERPEKLNGSMKIGSGNTVSGHLYFEVPIDKDTITLRYGKYLTIENIQIK